MAHFISSAYVQKRSEAHAALRQHNANFIYTSPRTLLAIMRMSQALARLRFQLQVHEQDVLEALRIMDASKKSLETAQSQSNLQRQVDPCLRCYQEIKRFALESSKSTLSLSDIRNRLRVAGGFDETVLEQCLRDYEEQNVLYRTGDSIHFVDVY